MRAWHLREKWIYHSSNFNKTLILALARAISILSVCLPSLSLDPSFVKRCDLQKHLYVLKNLKNEDIQSRYYFRSYNITLFAWFRSLRLVVERTIVTQRMKMEHESGWTGIKRHESRCPMLLPNSYNARFVPLLAIYRLHSTVLLFFDEEAYPPKRSTTISILARLLGEWRWRVYTSSIHDAKYEWFR